MDKERKEEPMLCRRQKENRTILGAYATALFALLILGLVVSFLSLKLL